MELRWLNIQLLNQRSFKLLLMPSDDILSNSLFKVHKAINDNHWQSLIKELWHRSKKYEIYIIIVPRVLLRKENSFVMVEESFSKLFCFNLFLISIFSYNFILNIKDYLPKPYLIYTKFQRVKIDLLII
jgi:hypothetical protein